MLGTITLRTSCTFLWGTCACACVLIRSIPDEMTKNDCPLGGYGLEAVDVNGWRCKDVTLANGTWSNVHISVSSSAQRGGLST